MSEIHRTDPPGDHGPARDGQQAVIDGFVFFTLTVAVVVIACLAGIAAAAVQRWA